jgi:thioredoxin-dependent peroxiredoxin
MVNYLFNYLLIISLTFFFFPMFTVGSEMKLTVEDYAPEFVLPSGSGENLSLNEFLEKKNVVLYFYPRDDTPGCTMEAKNFRDRISDFSTLDTVIIGVSQDSIQSHANFKEKYSLPFYLVSDENAEMLKKYGVWVEKSMFGKKYWGIERATFLINKKGKIVKIWRNVKVIGHVAEVLKEVKSMQPYQN